MLKKIICTFVLLFVVAEYSLANQIDDISPVLQDIKSAFADKDSLYTKISRIFVKLEAYDQDKADYIFDRLIEKCLEESNEQNIYAAYLMAAVYNYDKHNHLKSIGYTDQAGLYCHKRLQQTYLLFIKGLNYILLKKFDKADVILHQVSQMCDSNVDAKLIKCESLKALSDFSKFRHNDSSAYYYLSEYLKMSDTLSRIDVINDCVILPHKLHIKYFNRDAYFDNQEKIDQLRDQSVILTLSVALVLSLAAGASVIAIKTGRSNTKLKKLNKIIDAKAEELTSKTGELQAANDELAKLSIVAGCTVNAVCIANGNGAINWINKGFEDLFGLDKNQYILMNGENFFNSKNETERLAFESCRSLRKPQTFESSFTAYDKSNRRIQSTVSPVFDTNGDISHYVVIDFDISRIKNAEDAVMKQNKLLIEQKSDLENLYLQITAQRDELEFKNLEILRQNELITGSIKSARSLQQFIMSDVSAVTDEFESFILFKPKDIVSGDFYWFVKSENENYLAVGDCTGHGVSGAFMSVLCYSMLNDIVVGKNIHNPKDILSELEKKINITLKQKETGGTDGLDISICKISKNPSGADMIFAGAKSFFFLYNSAKGTTERYKGTKKSIGGIFSEIKIHEFEQIVFTLNHGDCIYLTSDGIIDQNNEERRCFGSPRLINTLDECGSLPMQMQLLNIEQQLSLWQGEAAQRDDICMVGIKI